MMKKMMAIFGVAAALAVTAKEINNFFDGDFPRLIPSVQKLERTEKGFRLPADLAIAAPAEAEREAKLAGAFISGRFGAFKTHLAAEGEAAGMRLVLTEEGVPGSPEGYTLSISPAGILIKARDVRGLFYGVQTFGNIVRNNVVVTLPSCEIVDFPDLDRVPEGLIECVHAKGLKLCLRAGDTPEAVAKMVALGLDYIPTNVIVPEKT